MGIVYVIMWFTAGFLLMFPLAKENKFFRILGGYFFVQGLWWLADFIYPDLGVFEGTYNYVLKAITAVVLALIGIFYYKNVWKKK